jgi:hypothetical protein
MIEYFFVTVEKFEETTQHLIGFTDDGRQIGIPADEGNMDYQAYLAWVDEGNTAEEWTGN